MSASGFSVLFLALTVALGAQDAPATFKSNTNLVIVNVTVRDKSGKPINSLKKADFQLLEDGKPQAISVSELQKRESDVLPPVVTPEKKLLDRNTVQPTAQPQTPPSPERLRDRR